MIDEGPGEHDAHLMDDDLDETVPCARCGQDIWAYAQRCPECGVHFSGEAWQFHPAGESPARRSHWWYALIVALMILGLLAWLF